MTSTAPKTGPSPVAPGIYKKPQLQQNAIQITNLGAISRAPPLTVQIMAQHSIIINGGSVDGVKKKESVFVVILTSDNYLAGVILLHYSIKRHSKYPLVVAVVPSRVSQESIQVLKESGCRIRNGEYLAPECEYDVVAERFRDTWTKLRVFELHEFEVSSVFFPLGGSQNPCKAKRREREKKKKKKGRLLIISPHFQVSGASSLM